MRAVHLTAAGLAVVLLAGCINVNVRAPSFGGGDGDKPGQLPGGSRDSAQGVTGAMLGAEQGLLFYAFNTLAYPREPVDLAARTTTPTLDGVKGATITFYDNRSQLVGSAVADERGTATVAWTPPAQGDYRFTAGIVSLPEGTREGRNVQAITPAPLLVAARSRDGRFVVIDLDHTIVDSSFWRVLLGSARPAEDSVRVTKRIAAKYNLIYLTHRPDLLTRKSKEWLAQHGYPPAPLLVSDVKSALPGSGAFKTARLAEITKAYPNVEIGIGDKISDAQAYVDSGLVAYLLPDCDRDDAKNMRKMADQLRLLRDRGKIQVVSNWRQVEAGIFSGKRFAPKAFGDSLTRQADRLDAERKAKKDPHDEDHD